MITCTIKLTIDGAEVATKEVKEALAAVLVVAVEEVKEAGYQILGAHFDWPESEGPLPPEVDAEEDDEESFGGRLVADAGEKVLDLGTLVTAAKRWDAKVEYAFDGDWFVTAPPWASWVANNEHDIIVPLATEPYEDHQEIFQEALDDMEKGLQPWFPDANRG